MPLITAKPELKFEKIRFKIPSNLLQEINAYCEAFEIKTVDDFFCQAFEYVLKTDRDWHKIRQEK